MGSISSMNQFEQYQYLNRFVIYVNPRQYHRMLRRRMERSRFLQKRGRPRPVYVPISVRDHGLRYVPNEGYCMTYDNSGNYMNQSMPSSCATPYNSNINIYINNPINSNVAGTSVSHGMNAYNMTQMTQMSQMNNNNMYNNGYYGVYNTNMDNDNANQYQNMQMNTTDNHSQLNLNPYGNMYWNNMNYNSTGYQPPDLSSNNANFQQTNNNYSSTDCQPVDSNYNTNYQFSNTNYSSTNYQQVDVNYNKDMFGVFDQFPSQNEVNNSYENYMINATLANLPNMAPGVSSNMFNTNGSVRLKSKNVNRILRLSNNGAGRQRRNLNRNRSSSSNGSNSSNGKGSTRCRRSNSISSSNSIDDIKTKYLQIDYSPFSESSLIKKLVPNPKKIYNINDQGLIMDIIYEDEKPLVNYRSKPQGEAKETKEASTGESIEDYNHITSSTFPEEKFEKDKKLNTDFTIDEYIDLGKYIKAITTDTTNGNTNTITKNGNTKVKKEQKSMFTDTTDTNNTNGNSSKVKNMFGDNENDYQIKGGPMPSKKASNESNHLYKQLYECFTE